MRCVCECVTRIRMFALTKKADFREHTDLAYRYEDAALTRRRERKEGGKGKQ